MGDTTQTLRAIHIEFAQRLKQLAPNKHMPCNFCYLLILHCGFPPLLIES